MCIISDNNINVISLIDISTIGAPTDTEFNFIATLLQDVVDSTLTLRDGSATAFNQIILYDQQQYIQPANQDATSINIDQCCGNRTPLNDLPSAIRLAMDEFDGLNNDPQVLIIFNGQQQSDYPDDPANVCPLRAELDDFGMTLL